MGLGLYAGKLRCAGWSYGGFNRFRMRLAESAGRTLESYWGAADSVHGVGPLLDHSDCDGELTPEQCAEIIPALQQIIVTWSQDDYDRQQAEGLLNGMRHAMAEQINIRFC